MIENHVTSLEISKKLKELGVIQKTYFHWRRKYTIKDPHGFFVDHCNKGVIENPLPYETFYSAFLASELGEIIKKFNIQNTLNLEIEGYDTYDFYNLVLKPIKNIPFESIYIKEKTECDARAKMLIHLIENNIIKAEDLK